LPFVNGSLFWLHAWLTLTQFMYASWYGVFICDNLSQWLPPQCLNATRGDNNNTNILQLQCVEFSTMICSLNTAIGCVVVAVSYRRMRNLDNERASEHHHQRGTWVVGVAEVYDQLQPQQRHYLEQWLVLLIWHGSKHTRVGLGMIATISPQQLLSSTHPWSLSPLFWNHSRVCELFLCPCVKQYPLFVSDPPGHWW